MKNIKNNHIPGKPRIICLIILISMFIQGCDYENTIDNSGYPATSRINGIIVDGPIIYATLNIYDNTGTLIQSTTSDDSAQYSIDITATPDQYPLVIESFGGIDLVTNRRPDFTLSTVIESPSELQTVNINTFSTIIVESAKLMSGGLTGNNIDQAKSLVSEELNFGLDENVISDPISTDITKNNAAIIVKSSEALGELVRRMHQHTADTTSDIDDTTKLIAKLITSPETQGEIKNMDALNVLSTQILTETIRNELKIDGVDVKHAMDASLKILYPEIQENQQTDNVKINQSIINQTRSAVIASRHVLPVHEFSSLIIGVGQLEAGSLSDQVLNKLPESAAVDNSTITAISSEENLPTDISVTGSSTPDTGNPTQSVITPVQLTTETTQPITASVQPITIPTQPVAISAQPVAEPVQPALASVQPATEPVQPAIASVQPATEPVQPAIASVQPVAEPVQPAIASVQPAAEPVQTVATPQTPIVLLPPNIDLLSPQNSDNIQDGDKVYIYADAWDTDGEMKKVDIYVNDKVIATVTTPPYSFDWENVAAGDYAIKAKATDTDNHTKISKIVNITVAPPAISTNEVSVSNLKISEAASDVKVTVRLLNKALEIVEVRYATKPGSGTPGEDYIGQSGLLQFQPGQSTQTITIKLKSDEVIEGTEYFNFIISSPKNATIVNNTARITIIDNDNEVAELKPDITLILPVDGTSFDDGSVIQIKANATDSDGSIQDVSFYHNGNLLRVDTTEPYVYNWKNATVGSHDITIVAKDNHGLTQESSTHRINVTEVTLPESPLPQTGGSLITHPVKDSINKYKSDRFSVRVSQNGNSRNSFVYHSKNTADPGWSGTTNYMQNANHWTSFSFDGDISIDAKRLDGKAISTCVVRPLALKIESIIEGNNCSFTLNKPAMISVEIDENFKPTRTFNSSGSVTKHIIKHPLFVFANPVDNNIPKASDPNVVYFGPGVHNIGKEYKIKNNTQVYIAAGAYVIGTLKSAEKNPKNISIRGRGILSGVSLRETSEEHNSWGNHSIDFSNGHDGSNLLIEGITITDPIRSCIISYNEVDIRRIKLFSWSHRNDGITVGNNSVIEDSFIKVTDDNIKLYYSNITVRRNVVWQQTAGAVFKFAWKLAGKAQNNHISDIDLIHSDVFDDYSAAEKDRPEFRSTSAVFSSMGFRKDAAFKNNSFKNIRIEEKYLYRLMGLRMVTTHEHPTDPSKDIYWGDPSLSASKLIENITFENISIAGTPHRNGFLYGNKGGIIRNMTFKNLKINGTVITSRGMLESKIDGAGFKTEGNTANISFIN